MKNSTRTIVSSSLIIVTCLFCGFSAANYRYNFFSVRSGGSMHVSIDDTILVFEDITRHCDEYHSIFDNYTFAFLKRMHDSYGLDVSMYCWYENSDFNLSMGTYKFRREFEENSDWLRFNYHGFNDQQDPGDINPVTFAKQYDLFRASLENIVGKKSWDKFTRLHLFNGKQEAISYMKDRGTTGFYCADDDRVSYQLPTIKIDNINEHRVYYDNDSNITYKKTDIRLDYYDDPYFVLYSFRWNDLPVEVFTYEWLISVPKGASIWKLEEVCDYSVNYEVSFCF